jgi:hypothetical protein
VRDIIPFPVRANVIAVVRSSHENAVDEFFDEFGRQIELTSHEAARLFRVLSEASPDLEDDTLLKLKLFMLSKGVTHV